MESEAKPTISVISSGYSSGSGTTLNYTMSSQNQPNYSQANESSAIKIDKKSELSAIVSNFENERKFKNYDSKGFTSYVTGGHINRQKNDSNLSELSDSSENSESAPNRPHIPRLETLVNRASFDPNSTEKLSAPFVHDEQLVQDVLAKAGPAYAYQRSDYKNDIGSLNDLNVNDSDGNLQKGVLDEFDEHGNMLNLEKPTFSTSSSINQDASPIRIVKPNNQQNVVYKQQVNIRYLQPPTPPPPAPIIIREKQAPAPPKQPPIIIRQTEPAPSTPAPLIIRERAPTPPSPTEPTVIEVISIFLKVIYVAFDFNNYAKSYRGQYLQHLHNQDK